MIVRVAIAQCAPALGATKRNLAMHAEWIGRAHAAGARLVVFPELSLTGYYLRDLAGDVACAADDPRLAAVAEASRDLDICAGFVERAADARLFIAQGYWSAGRLVHVHRKVYLPTYGIFDDGRYFGAGERFDVFASALGPTGLAICEDLWHVSVPYVYAVGGATTVIAPSASPGRGVAEGGDLGTAESCRLMNRFYAQYLTLFVLYVSRVGHEDGITFWGGSEVVAPDGSVLARAPEFEEHLLVADLDTELVARERDRNPLMRDERPDLVQSHLAQRTRLRPSGEGAAREASGPGSSAGSAPKERPARGRAARRSRP